MVERNNSSVSSEVVKTHGEDTEDSNYDGKVENVVQR